MKPDLVSPDFLFTFGFASGKHTGNISISEMAISNLLRKSNVSIKSSQRGIRVSYYMITFNMLWGFFHPHYAIVIVKRDECRNRVILGIAKQL